MIAVALCVPVRDEAALLPSLLDALSRQRDLDGMHVIACFLLDGCTDASADVIARWVDRRGDVRIEEVAREPTPDAGRARRCAMAMGQAAVAGEVDAALLTTDADSVPAADWIAANLRALTRADVVAGRIERLIPRAPGRAHAVQARVEAYYDRLFALRRALDPVSWEAPRTHHYTSGASLAFRVNAYAAIGGFATRRAGEDAHAVDTAHACGLHVRRDADVVVRTSSRTRGRAVGGLADHLRDLEARADPPTMAHPADAAWRYAGHAAARDAFDALRAGASPEALATRNAGRRPERGGVRDARRAAEAGRADGDAGRRGSGLARHRAIGSRPAAMTFAQPFEPAVMIARLRALSASLDRFDDPADSESMLTLLRRLHDTGRRDLPLGRLFEGHVDALQIVMRYAPAEIADAVAARARGGALFGVWNAELHGEALRQDPVTITGGKSYASGAGVLSHALVSLDAQGGRQLLLVDLEAAPPAIDRDFWHVVGMQRSQTHIVRWTDAPAHAFTAIGVPGDYVREPWFGGGALRFVAVQAGGIAALCDHVRDHLVASGRAEDPHQAGRLAALFDLADGAAAAVRAAADAWFGDEFARLPRVAAARVRVAAAADAALTVAQQAVGLPGMFDAHPLSAALTDLMVYLRQPAPDAQRMAVGGAVADGRLVPRL